MRRRAFTLVELLIVIGIIAALAGILLPAVNRAREMGKRTVCLSNIRQLQMAWLAYAYDHKGRFCNSGFTTRDQDTFGQGGAWLRRRDSMTAVIDFSNSRIWPYLPNVSSYYCPNDDRFVKGTFDPAQRQSDGKLASWGEVTSYDMNGLMGCWGMAPATSSGVSNAPGVRKMTMLNDIKRPAGTFVFIEVNPRWTGWGEFVPPVYPNITQAGAETDGGPRSLFHRRGSVCEGCTISFADGHAIFWNYAAAINVNDSAAVGNFGGGVADVRQLAAWSGAPILPPGVAQ